jgi:hypothetical protein
MIQLSKNTGCLRLVSGEIPRTKVKTRNKRRERVYGVITLNRECTLILDLGEILHANALVSIRSFRSNKL